MGATLCVVGGIAVVLDGGGCDRAPARHAPLTSAGGVSRPGAKPAGDHRPVTVAGPAPVAAPPEPEPVQVVKTAPVAMLAPPIPEMVTVKIAVDPPKRAHIFWGVKDLGLAPLEIQRPRGSGPLDLILSAPGYLTVHTRAFTDRDDKLAFKLVPETDAARMFGYHPRQGR